MYTNWVNIFHIANDNCVTRFISHYFKLYLFIACNAFFYKLAGNAYYFGKLYEKPTLGDADRPVEYEDIRRAGRLLYGTAVLALLVFLAVKGVVLWVI